MKYVDKGVADWKNISIFAFWIQQLCDVGRGLLRFETQDYKLQYQYSMKRLFLILILVASTIMASAQSYSDTFYSAFNIDDIAAQRQVLADWEQAAPDDVDYLIAKYNFYANQSVLTISDSLGAGVSETFSFCNEPMADSALMVINAAIERYPTRLDLRFGKIYFLGSISHWDDMADEIVAMLDYSDQIGHSWVYPNMDGGMKELLSESILDYQLMMYNTLGDWDNMQYADSAMLMRMRRVAKRTIQVFPQDIPAINMLAITYTSFKDYDNAIKYLLRAEQLDPTDEVVLQNLADNYAMKGDKRKSKQYQDRIVKK